MIWLLNLLIMFSFKLNYFPWGLKTSTGQDISFLLETTGEIFWFKTEFIPWAPVQNIGEDAKNLDILVTNTKFSVALATSWLQFQTLDIHHYVTLKCQILVNELMSTCTPLRVVSITIIFFSLKRFC